MPDLKGKVCLITGASSGIERDAALGLSQMGASVVLVYWDKSKAEKTLNIILCHAHFSISLKQKPLTPK